MDFTQLSLRTNLHVPANVFQSNESWCFKPVTQEITSKRTGKILVIYMYEKWLPRIKAILKYLLNKIDLSTTVQQQQPLKCKYMYVLSETQIYMNSMTSLTSFKIKKEPQPFTTKYYYYKNRIGSNWEKKTSLILSSKL